MTHPVLSIVIVNSDGCADTLNCLESVERCPPGVSWEVVLVDNCSNDGCLEQAERRFARVRTFQAAQRQGFARNYNLGLRQARGEYRLILNNDTLLNPGALDALLAELQAHPEYGFAGPQLRSADGSLQTTCARKLPGPGSYLLKLFLLDLALPSGRWWERRQQRQLERRPSGPVPCLSGACMLSSRERLERIGLLDEGFDFYYEDVEWCHRARRLGYQAGYCAAASIIHLGDRSLGRVKERAKRAEYRSAVRYFRLYHGLGDGGERLLRLATAASYFLRSGVYALLGLAKRASGGGEREAEYARAYLRLGRGLLLAEL